MTYYGIYKITNLSNGKMYIGKHKTSDIDDGYMGSGKIILRALKKYGKENFRKEWLMFCEDEEEMNYMERVFVDQTWVDRSDTYNINLGGVGGAKKGNGKGTKRTEETKRRMSIAQQKFYKSSASILTKQKIGKANKGRKHTLKEQQKMWVPVCQYTKDGQFVAEYESLNEAEEKTGVLHNNISKVCTGKRPYAGGCVWTYKERM